uniref:Protein ARV n=1 Tax=Leersia perrieri TaxID=77586 RepID=A0A0D9VZU2_9ORYZ
MSERGEGKGENGKYIDKMWRLVADERQLTDDEAASGAAAGGRRKRLDPGYLASEASKHALVAAVWEHDAALLGAGVRKLCAKGFSLMGDAEEEEERPRCVGCGRRVKTLYVQYSPGNIRLMKCDTCKAVADPYIECEFMIILIDLILHKIRAYRHLLFNKLRIYSSFDKGILVLSILLHIVLDAFRISLPRDNKADSSTSTFSAIFNCGKILGYSLLGNIIFMATLLLEVQFMLKLSFDIRRCREVLLAIIISSYLKLFHMAMMVWEFPPSVILFVEISVLSSNIVALRVVTEFSKAHCFGICFMAHTARYLTERWLLGAP